MGTALPGNRACVNPDASIEIGYVPTGFSALIEFLEQDTENSETTINMVVIIFIVFATPYKLIGLHTQPNVQRQNSEDSC
jgi:hypothetical protein